MQQKNSVFMKIFFLTFSWFAAVGSLLVAQPTTLQIVTKKVEKTFPYLQGTEVNIEGQKADIQIDTWTEDRIEVTIEFTAKHPELQLAKEDVEKINYQATRVKNKIYLRNYLSSQEEAPKSLLSIRYYIRMPEQCPVYLKNEFGNANLSNLTNKLTINSSFTEIGLSELSGILEVKTKFGNLMGRNLNTQAVIRSRRSNVKLQNIQGTCDIEAYYGVVEVSAHPNLSLLKIYAEKSDVYAYADDPNRVAYEIETYATPVSLPNILMLDNQEATSEKMNYQYRPKNEFYTLFKLHVNFGDIKIGKARTAP